MPKNLSPKLLYVKIGFINFAFIIYLVIQLQSYPVANPLIDQVDFSSLNPVVEQYRQLRNMLYVLYVAMAIGFYLLLRLKTKKLPQNTLLHSIAATLLGLLLNTFAFANAALISSLI